MLEVDVLGYAASATVLATFCMTTASPLPERVFTQPGPNSEVARLSEGAKELQMTPSRGHDTGQSLVWWRDT